MAFRGKWLGLGLSLLAALGLVIGEADAFVSLDFEQQYFVEEVDVRCKDHSVIFHDGVYHVYYIQSFEPEPGEYLRKEKWFGHISSPDLRHWSRHDSILSVDYGNPLDWESFAVWAPCVMEDPNSSDWLIWYTGVNDAIAQRTGLASSHNLFDWYRFPGNPIYQPGSWAQWSETSWSNCRDPDVFFHESDGWWYLFNSVTIAGVDSLGAVGHAISNDLVSWTDRGALFVNDSQNVLESVRIVERDGYYHMFFTEGGEGGISHILNSTLTGGWDKENRVYVSLGHAAEITPLSGETNDLFSVHSGVNSIVGGISYLRFATVDFDTPDHIPVVEDVVGFTSDWLNVFGDAFENQPTWGDNPRERGSESSKMKGNSYVATFEDFPHPNLEPLGRWQGVVPVGMVRSMDFTVTGDRLSLQVGGGDSPALCFVALIRSSDEQLLFWETGTDSYAMVDKLWNLSTLLGETVRFVIADLSSDAGGHISVDTLTEYEYSGWDPIPPSDPLVDGPFLRDVLDDAGFGWVGVEEPGPPPAGTHARLLPPHPNPFNPRTRLRYELGRAGEVELHVLDAGGRSVRRLFAGRLDAGPGFFTWDGRNDEGQRLPSGLYLARLSLDGVGQGGQKLILLQ